MLVWKCDRCGKEYEDTPMIKITKRGGGVQEILFEKQDENEDEQHYADLCPDCAERFYEWWLEGDKACQYEELMKIAREATVMRTAKKDVKEHCFG